MLQLLPETENFIKHSRANQDNTLRINKGIGYDNQRVVNIAGAKENVAKECQKLKWAKDAAYHKEKMILCKQEEAEIQLSVEQADWKDDTDDELGDQELEAHYMYMAQIQEVTLDAADNFGPIFDVEPLQKEQGDTNITTKPLDMSTNGETVDQDDDDIAKEYLKKFQAKLDMYHDVNYASKVDIDYAKAKGDLISYKMESQKSLTEHTQKINDLNQTTSEMKKELFTYQESIFILSQEKEAQNKFYKTREDEEIEKVIALENKVKVLDDIVYKTGQLVQTMNMLNCNCKMSFVKLKCERLKNNLSKRNTTTKSFEELQQHAINLELALQQSRELLNNDKVWKQRESNSFRELNVKYFEIQDEKAQLQDKDIAIITTQILPQNVKSILKNTNVIAPVMYKVHTNPNQTRTPQLPQDIRKTNKRVYFDTKVIPTTSVSRPQLNSNQLEDRVMHKNSQEKKQQVEDHHRNFKFSNNKTSVTTCNDSLNAKTLNVNFVCVTCGKCVLNDNHDMCVLHYINGMHTRTKQPIVVPISTREPKRTVNQSVATPLKKIGYEWEPKSKLGNVNTNVSMPLEIETGASNILESITLRGSTLSNTLLSSNSFAACRDNSLHHPLWVLKAHDGKFQALSNFTEELLGTVKFGNDQIASILGYGDLVQGNVTIKMVCYVEGLNHNLFSVGQFCDVDLEVAFWKSTCYIRDLKGNDLLTGSYGLDLYSITLQDTFTPNLICLMAKATSSQTWLWHRHLLHLNFDTINLLSKYDIVTNLPKLKFIKDHLYSSCELGKVKRKSFKTKTTPSSKRRLQILYMDLCGPMRVESINGKKYVLVIVDDYSRYTWTHFLRSKDETPEVLIDFLKLFQRGLHAQVRKIQTDKGTDGGNLDKIKEKGDVCIFVGYSTQSRAYKVYNNRPRVKVETIHVNFKELPQTAPDHVSSDPVPPCLTMALEHDSLSPGQNAGNPAGYNDVIGNQNQIGNGNLVVARAKGNAAGKNRNQIRCYNCRGVARAEGNAAGKNRNQIRCYNCRGVGHYARNCTVRPRRRDAAYLQTQLLIAQKEEAGI
nr:hypothetical protein [Tanacetum cinerariifolium]